MSAVTHFFGLILTPFIFFIILLLLPLVTWGGRLNSVSFEAPVIRISHDYCLLEPPIKEKRKLILPLKNCAADAEKLELIDDNLKSIHWAQHDFETVWIVATFAADYQFKLLTQPDQVRVCLPQCDALVDNTITALANEPKTLFLLRGIRFQVPLEDMLIEEFLERSIGFIPTDMIRDGLPHFGSKRDDWQGKTRKHKGYDTYINNINVLASAAGIVTKVGRTQNAGLYVKLSHGYNLYTVYVHIREAFVKKGQKVKQGEVIGRVEGPHGNAIAPQLHFEVKINNESIDPLPLIEEFYRDNEKIAQQIKKYKQKMLEMVKYRETLVKQWLKEH
ncbi:MAG: M23 family metallopeptidase [Pseudomonadota bacterium]|nr:M23 family metallopeptidase [Pseudomonadota bacterium]